MVFIFQVCMAHSYVLEAQQIRTVGLHVLVDKPHLKVVVCHQSNSLTPRTLTPLTSRMLLLFFIYFFAFVVLCFFAIFARVFLNQSGVSALHCAT